MSGIEGVLKAHWEYDLARSDDAWACICGSVIWDGRTAEDGRALDDDRRAHVAAEVRAWLAEELAGEGLHAEVVRAIYGGGLDGAPEVARSALAAVREHLTGEAT